MAKRESIPAPSQGGGQNPGKERDAPFCRRERLRRAGQSQAAAAAGGEAPGAKTEPWEHGQTAAIECTGWQSFKNRLQWVKKGAAAGGQTGRGAEDSKAVTKGKRSQSPPQWKRKRTETRRLENILILKVKYFFLCIKQLNRLKYYANSPPRGAAHADSLRQAAGAGELRDEERRQHPALTAALCIQRLPHAPRKTLQCTAASVSHYLVQNWSKMHLEITCPPCRQTGCSNTPKTPLLIVVKMVHSFLAQGLKRFLVYFFVAKGFRVLHR